MEGLNFVIESGIYVFLIIIGALIFDFVAVLCGYKIFIRKDNYFRPLLLSLFVGLVALLFSNIPNDLINICCKDPTISSPQILGDILTYLRDIRNYDKLFLISISLAFLISGAIESDFLEGIRKAKAHMKHVRMPTNCWDLLMWYYGSTGDRVRIYLNPNNDYIEGKLDFRSIGDEPEDIILKEPMDSQKNILGKFILVRETDIHRVALKDFHDYNMVKAFKHTFGVDWLYVITFFVGVFFLITFIIQPNWILFYPFKTWPEINFGIAGIIVALNLFK